MEKKYELVKEKTVMAEDGEPVYQIMALRDVRKDVGGEIVAHKGELGGYIRDESNLSQEGGAWVEVGCYVFQSARVENDAVISDTSTVYGHAVVKDNARVEDHSRVCGCATIAGSAQVFGAYITDSARVLGEAKVIDSAIKGYVTVDRSAIVEEYSIIDGRVRIGGEAKVIDSTIKGYVTVDGSAIVEEGSIIDGRVRIDGEVKVYNSMMSGLASITDKAILAWSWAKGAAILKGDAICAFHFTATAEYADGAHCGDSNVYAEALKLGYRWKQSWLGKTLMNWAMETYSGAAPN